MKFTRKQTPAQRMLSQISKMGNGRALRTGLAVVGGLVSATAASAVTSAVRHPRTKQ